MSMRTDDFDYNLPEELIAQAPAEPRDSCRLLVVDRKGSEAGAPLVIYGTDGAPIHLAQASFSHF